MKLSKISLVCLLVTSTFICVVNSMNVLVVKVSATKSHNNFFGGIIDSLLENNHTVTFVSMFALEDHKNLNQIIVESTDMNEVLGNNIFDTSPITIMKKYVEHLPKMCNKDLAEPRVQKALQDKFDVAILSMFMTDCFLSAVHNQKIPFIYASTLSMIPPYTDKLGDLFFPSVSPQKMMPYTYPLSFKEKVLGLIGEIGSTFSNIYVINKLDQYCRDQNLCPSDMTHLSEMGTTASLALVNSVRALEVPVKTAVPAIIFIGGIHIKPPKPLPQDLQQWIDNSGDDGVIYFSLGTAVTPSHMKKEHIQTILRVFGALKQRVLWKYNLDNLEDVPPNVKLSKWFPQQAILAHPKTRVFITHGGLFSTQESTYYDVPVIGMPVFVDQINNIAQVEAEGWGLKLNWDHLTDDSLRKMIITALTDQKLRDICTKRSKIMKDQLVSPSVTANYWVEYVVRHQGAKHLRSPFINMPWYKVYNMDVWMTIIFIITSIIILLIKLLQFLFNILRRLIFKRKTKED